MFENFPYTDMHQLNLDWIIKIAKDFLDQYTHIQQLISDGETSLQNLTTDGLEQLQDKADNLEALLQAWYDTHSSDIANQLADALADLNEWYNTHQNYLDNTLTEKINIFNGMADQKTAESIASIPDDYTTLANNVTQLGTDLKELHTIEVLDSKLISTGKNLFNKDLAIQGYYYNKDDGKKYPNANYCTEKINIGANVTFTVNKVWMFAFYKADGTFISGDFNSSNTEASFTTPALTEYMMASAQISNLNTLQIELGTAATPFEAYYNHFTYNKPRDYILVDLAGRGDFTKITDALAYAETHPNTTIYVEEGTYDIIAELGSSYFENFVYVAYTNEGPKIGNGTTLIMSSTAKIVCHYTGSNAEVLRGFSPLNAYLDNLGFTLDNVTIECSNVRYCVHDDVGSERSMYKNVYRNCKFTINNTTNPVYPSHCALGGGLGQAGEVIIENCIFENLMNDGVYSYAVAYHNSGENTGRERSRIVFTGNYVTGIDTVQFTDHGTTLYKTYCLVSNNNLGAEVRHRKTDPSVPDNMEVLEWNNYIRTN